MADSIRSNCPEEGNETEEHICRQEAAAAACGDEAKEDTDKKIDTLKYGVESLSVCLQYRKHATQGLPRSKELLHALKTLESGSKDEWEKLMEEGQKLEIEMTNMPHKPADKPYQGHNYLFLDPRITQLMNTNMKERDMFETFLNAVFFVGKKAKNGKYTHLKKPADGMECSVHKMIENIRKDLKDKDFNEEDLILEVFETTSQLAARTRKEVMIEAMDVDNLCNHKKGTYQGPETWKSSEKCKLGSYLFYQAFKVYLKKEKQKEKNDIRRYFQKK